MIFQRNRIRRFHDLVRLSRIKHKHMYVKDTKGKPAHLYNDICDCPLTIGHTLPSFIALCCISMTLSKSYN